MCRTRSGYTLLEVVLVLAVIMIVAALGVSSMNGMGGNVRVNAAADGVRAAWADARSHAINEGRPYRFAIVPNQNHFRIAPDDPAYWSGADAPKNSTGSENPPLVKEDSLPKGIVFTTNDSSSGAMSQPSFSNSDDSSHAASQVDPSLWSTTAVFLPDGSAREDASITFQEKGSKPLTLKLRALTGTVTLEQ